MTTSTRSSNKQNSIKKPIANTTVVNNGFRSRFDGVSNKIFKYRELQQKAQEDAQKSADQRMKELEKEQKNQSVPITQQWFENLGKFTGIRAQNNPAAQPTAKPLQPINTTLTPTSTTQNKVAFVHLIKNSLAVIDKYAAFNEKVNSHDAVAKNKDFKSKQPSSLANTNSPTNVKYTPSGFSGSQEDQLRRVQEQQKFQKEPCINRQLSFWGPLLLDVFGLTRKDTDKYFQGNIANINADPRKSIGQTKYYDTEYYQSRRPL